MGVLDRKARSGSRADNSSTSTNNSHTRWVRDGRECWSGREAQSGNPLQSPIRCAQRRRGMTARRTTPGSPVRRVRRVLRRKRSCNRQAWAFLATLCRRASRNHVRPFAICVQPRPRLLQIMTVLRRERCRTGFHSPETFTSVNWAEGRRRSVRGSRATSARAGIPAWASSVGTCTGRSCRGGG